MHAATEDLNQIHVEFTEKSLSERLSPLWNLFKSASIGSLKHLSYALPATALIVDVMDTILVKTNPEWLANHSCIQADNSHDFSKDIPKIIFLLALASCSVADLVITKSCGLKKRKQIRQVVDPIMATIANTSFLENLQPHLRFDSLASVRLCQSIIGAKLVKDLTFFALKPNVETLKNPIIAAPLKTLDFVERSIVAGTLTYTTCSTFADIFVLALMTQDPTNFYPVLNYIALAGLSLGALSFFNEKTHNFFEHYIAPATSNWNLSMLSAMSFLNCFAANLSGTDRPMLWLAASLAVHAFISTLTTVKTQVDMTARNDEIILEEQYAELNINA